MAAHSTSSPERRKTVLSISQLSRRLAGIAVLLLAALAYSPYAQGLQQTLVLPVAAALGVWLIFPNPVLLSFTVTMLAAAHSQPGASELLSGYVYPALTVTGAISLVVAWRRREDASE